MLSPKLSARSTASSRLSGVIGVPLFVLTAGTDSRAEVKTRDAANLTEIPERARQAQARQDRLVLLAGVRAPVRVEAIAPPGLG